MGSELVVLIRAKDNICSKYRFNEYMSIYMYTNECEKCVIIKITGKGANWSKIYNTQEYNNIYENLVEQIIFDYIFGVSEQ